MAINESAVSTSPQDAPLVTAPETADFDQRWAAWRAKGAARDRAFRRKMTIVAPVAIVVVGIIYALLVR